MENSGEPISHKDYINQNSTGSSSRPDYGRLTTSTQNVKGDYIKAVNSAESFIGHNVGGNLCADDLCLETPLNNLGDANGKCAIGSDTKECDDLLNHVKLERYHSVKRTVQFHEEPVEVVSNGTLPQSNIEDVLVPDDISSEAKTFLLSSIKSKGNLTSASSQYENCEEDEEDESSLEEQFSEPQPPDGGWGWVVVAAAFVTNLIADGATFTFGIIYVDLLRYFGEGKSKTAWIGGLFMSMPLISGPIASYLTDRFGCRRICIFGSILSAFGFVVSSYAQSIELLIITFGIISGFGLALCYVTAVVIVAYYFDKRRSLATGLSVCGSGIGTFLFAPLTTFLITEYGWRGTTLILAGLFLNISVCGALMRDLEWTKAKSKALRKTRKQKNRDKRKHKLYPQSLRSTVSSMGSFNQELPSVEELKRLLQRGETPGYMLSDKTENKSGGNEDPNRLCSSVLNLPTFVRNGEKVPVEVLELLSSNQNLYHVLMQNYPSLLAASRSCSDSGLLHENKYLPATNHTAPPSPLVAIPHPSVRRQSSLNYYERKIDRELPKNATTEEAYLWWLKKTRHQHDQQQHSSRRSSSTHNTRDLKFHRHSLTYRGAMLNLKKHRLRASSCPNIYRNPMNSSSKIEEEWYNSFYDLWDLMVDMVDVSHFTDIRFVLFAISNFLLYCWYDVPYMFLADKAREMGFTEKESSHIISYLGIFNTVGEVILGWAGDQRQLNAGIIYALCMAVCGLATALMPLIMSYTELCIVTGAFGLSIAANYSMASIILVELITLERFTNAYGLLLLVQGLANLVGPPLAGWLYDTTGTYDLSFYVAGFFIIICGVLLIVLPVMKWTKRWKEARTKTFTAASSKRNGIPKENKFICADNDSLKDRTLLPTFSKESNPV